MDRFDLVTEGNYDLAKIWGGLPRDIKVGPGRWKIQFEEGLKNEPGELLFGETRNMQMEIVLEPHQAFYQARDTVVHEILHAISSNVTYFAHRHGKIRDEEGMCRAFSPWLLQVIQDNPELLTWLQRLEVEETSESQKEETDGLPD